MQAKLLITASVLVVILGATISIAYASQQDKTLAAQVRRFDKVADILSHAQNRLDAIKEDLGSEGPSQDPAVIAEINNIISKANMITDTARGMLIGPTCGPTSPCPP